MRSQPFDKIPVTGDTKLLAHEGTGGGAGRSVEGEKGGTVELDGEAGPRFLNGNETKNLMKELNKKLWNNCKIVKMEEEKAGWIVVFMMILMMLLLLAYYVIQDAGNDSVRNSNDSWEDFSENNWQWDFVIMISMMFYYSAMLCWGTDITRITLTGDGKCDMDFLLPKPINIQGLISYNMRRFLLRNLLINIILFTLPVGFVYHDTLWMTKLVQLCAFNCNFGILLLLLKSHSRNCERLQRVAMMDKSFHPPRGYIKSSESLVFILYPIVLWAIVLAPTFTVFSVVIIIFVDIFAYVFYKKTIVPNSSIFRHEDTITNILDDVERSVIYPRYYVDSNDISINGLFNSTRKSNLSKTYDMSQLHDNISNRERYNSPVAIVSKYDLYGVLGRSNEQSVNSKQHDISPKNSGTEYEAIQKLSRTMWDRRNIGSWVTLTVGFFFIFILLLGYAMGDFWLIVYIDIIVVTVSVKIIRQYFSGIPFISLSKNKFELLYLLPLNGRNLVLKSFISSLKGISLLTLIIISAMAILLYSDRVQLMHTIFGTVLLMLFILLYSVVALYSVISSRQESNHSQVNYVLLDKPMLLLFTIFFAFIPTFGIPILITIMGNSFIQSLLVLIIIGLPMIAIIKLFLDRAIKLYDTISV